MSTTEQFAPTATTVHPTAVGSGTRPDMTEPSSQSSDSGSAQVGDSSSEYPKQLHAGAVGYGPNYHVGPVRGFFLSPCVT